MTYYTLLQTFGFANINYLTLCIMKIIYTRCIGQTFHLLIWKIRRQYLFTIFSFQKFPDQFFTACIQDFLEQYGCRVCIPSGTMPVYYWYIQSAADMPQSIFMHVRIGFATEFQCGQFFWRPIITGNTKMIFNK